MKSADVKDRFLNDGAEPIGGTADEFTALIKAELARWASVIRMSGAKVD